MNVKEHKKAMVVGLTDAGRHRVERLCKVMNRRKTSGIMRMLSVVVSEGADPPIALSRPNGGSSTVATSLAECVHCQPLSVETRTTSLTLMVTDRERARLRTLVRVSGVNGAGELIETVSLLCERLLEGRQSRLFRVERFGVLQRLRFPV